MPIPVAVPNLFPQPHTINANPMMQTPVVSIPSGFSNQGQNVQFVAIQAEHMQPFNYSEFSQGGGGFHRGLNGDSSFRGRGRHNRGNFARSQGENDA